MENKEIYIDGVDVSGCDFYDKNKKYCLTLKMDTTGFKNPSCFSGDFQKCIQDSKVCPYTFCDNNPNCYYKQLKRAEAQCEAMFVSHTDLEKKYKAKEQECEELKKQHQADKGLITSTGKQNYQLLQEYDKLKGKVKLYEEILERSAEGFETGTQASMFASIVKGVANSIRDEKLFKLKQTLTEIKEIAENGKRFAERYMITGEQKANVLTYANAILQKISECEE